MTKPLSTSTPGSTPHFDTMNSCGAGARAHDAPPGNNTPHAERRRVAAGLRLPGCETPVPVQQVKDYGLQSITDLIVRRPYGAGRTIALNAHGDVVPPGEGWTTTPMAARWSTASSTAVPRQ